jgi:hypothetical protein
LHSADAVFHIHSSDPNNVAILRGFDVVSIGEESKSLKKLTVKIDSESWDSVTETFTYRLYGALNMNCDTMECKASDPNVAYRVTVYSLVVSGEDDEFLATRGNLRDEDYCWGDRQLGVLGEDFDCTVGRDPVKGVEENRIEHRRSRSLTGEGGNAYPRAIMGLQRLTVQLDTDHHMLDFDMAMLPQSYNAASGRYDYDTRMFFKQWSSDMGIRLYQESVDAPDNILEWVNLLGVSLAYGMSADELYHFTVSSIGGWLCSLNILTADMCTFEHPGQAGLTTKPVLLQFDNGVVGDGDNVGGELYWPGGNLSADSDSAVVLDGVDFKDDF